MQENNKLYLDIDIWIPPQKRDLVSKSQSTNCKNPSGLVNSDKGINGEGLCKPYAGTATATNGACTVGGQCPFYERGCGPVN